MIFQKEKKIDNFLKSVERIIKKSFIPLTLGGGVSNLATAKFFLENMCDKVLINTALFEHPLFVSNLAGIYGNQSIIASVDYRIENDERKVFKINGTTKVQKILNK